MSATDKPIERLAFFDDPQLVGARWWQPSVTDDASGGINRRMVLMMVGGLLAAPAMFALAHSCSSDDGDLPDPNAQMRALELQRDQGWDVGSAGKLWTDSGFVDVDVDGSGDWRGHVTTLTQDLATAAAYQSWQVPTLLQMPWLSVNQSLAKALRPLRDEKMPSGWRTGRTLAHLIGQLPAPPMDTLLVVDLPGPQGVAVAAALADRLTPVWVLDGCPHPLGVVPWHRTLGALLYLLPELRRQASRRPPQAPPMLILDGQRLANYTDEAAQFDNRSLARLPQIGQLHAAGIRRLMLLTDQSRDRDDLNDQLQALAQGGIDIRLIDAGDFSGQWREVPGDPAPMQVSEAELQAAAALAPSALYDPTLRASYGPSPAHELAFWHALGWYLAAPPLPMGVAPVSSMAWRIAPRYSTAMRVGNVRYGRWRPYSSSFGSSSRSGSWTRSGGSSFG